VYETLMQHKNMLHTQIDLLIKEKRKLWHLVFLNDNNIGTTSLNCLYMI
jgi:hypothetical protein